MRFPLWVLFAVIGCVGLLVALIERTTREQFVANASASHLVPFQQLETEKRLDSWLRAQGFEPTDDANIYGFPFLPDDPELDRARYYSGRWNDSGTLFVCADPNAWGGETELDQYLSNICFQIYGNYPVRAWQFDRHHADMMDVMDAFHTWANALGPIPTKIEELHLSPEEMAKALSRKDLIHRGSSTMRRNLHPFQPPADR